MANGDFPQSLMPRPGTNPGGKRPPSLLAFSLSSVVNHKLRNKIKRMDFFVWQGARRRHSLLYGNDE